MNKLISSLSNISYTENGAISNKSTNSKTLDFFAQVGALRSRSKDEIISIFKAALHENRELAIKTLFFGRDIRGGLGERAVFRIILKWLGNEHPDIVINNINNIIEFGRWDDIFVLEGTSAEHECFTYIANQISEDINSENPSLCAKWVKSENASSGETRRVASIFRRNYMNCSSKEYRKTLSKLRERIRIVERDMSSNNWENINFETVPSRASLLYRSAFMRHQPERYSDYIKDVTAGKKNINAGVLYPHDIVGQIMNGKMVCDQERRMFFCDTRKDVNIEVLNNLWNNLPNYIENNSSKTICLVDVSGSMNGLPICAAISLGIYIGERNAGPFKDCFITFSKNPELIKIDGENIYEKVVNLSKSNWGMNTDFNRVFDIILERAAEINLEKSEMPERIIVLSDMEFDAASPKNFKTNFNEIRDKYAQYGYEMPELVFWNLKARNSQFPVTQNEQGAVLVSGFSPSLMKNILSNKDCTPYQMMLDTLKQERYNRIVF